MTNQQLAGMCKSAATALRASAGQIQTLESQVGNFQKKARAEQIVQKMLGRGLLDEEAREEKVAELTGRDDLDVLDQAIDLSTPDELAKLGSVSDESSATGDGASAEKAFEAFVLS